MLRAQRVAVLEHPAEPHARPLDAVDVETTCDYLAGGARTCQTSPFATGVRGPQPKPTALLVIAPEHEVVRNSFQRYLQSQHCQRRFLWVEWMASTALPDSRTTPWFCRALAGIAEAWGADSYFAPAIPQPESDLDFLAYVARLRCGFSQSAQRGLDCT